MTATRLCQTALFLLVGASLTSCSRSEDVTRDPEGSGASKQPIADGGVPACPKGTRGAEMVLIPFPNGTSYCIDKWPTTVGEYRTFLAEKDRLPAPPEPCNAKVGLEPTTEGEFTNCSAEVWGPNVDPAHTMQCVDWCSATRYCAWSGKRLCAGPHGASTNQPRDPVTGQDPLLAEPARNEWANACSAGGTRKYPYGDSYDPSKCEGQLADSVADHPQCRGPEGTPFNEVVGMVGLVQQWTGLCYGSTSMYDGCVIAGTYAGQPSMELAQRCDLVQDTTRSGIAVGLGIRCCSDSVPE
jgi:formylglycine-generating enzyme